MVFLPYNILSTFYLDFVIENFFVADKNLNLKLKAKKAKTAQFFSASGDVDTHIFEIIIEKGISEQRLVWR